MSLHHPHPAFHSRDRFVHTMDTDLMDRATAEREARRFAVHIGSAEAALNQCDTRGGSNEFIWALRHLSELESGSSIAWKADEKRAEWLAELAAACAPQADRVAA